MCQCLFQLVLTTMVEEELILMHGHLTHTVVKDKVSTKPFIFFPLIFIAIVSQINCLHWSILFTLIQCKQNILTMAYPNLKVVT